MSDAQNSQLGHKLVVLLWGGWIMEQITSLMDESIHKRMIH